MSVRKAAMFVSVLSMACGPANSQSTLEFLEEHKIFDKHVGLTEPSGLTLAPEGGDLLSVSDDSAKIFSLTTAGDARVWADLSGSGWDLEGVAFDARSARVLVASEKRAEILEIPLNSADQAKRYPLDRMAGFDALDRAFGNRNNGLEGIDVDPVIGRVFLVKERGPRVLIEVSPDLSRIVSVTPLTAEMGFRSPSTPPESLDVSGLAVDTGRKGLWILSDTDEAVFFLGFESGQARRFPIYWKSKKHKHRMKNPEGIALSKDGSRLFVVSDDGHDARLVSYVVED